MFSPGLGGFPPGTPVSLTNIKNMMVAADNDFPNGDNKGLMKIFLQRVLYCIHSHYVFTLKEQRTSWQHLKTSSVHSKCSVLLLTQG